jgi:hypothetical protein
MYEDSANYSGYDTKNERKKTSDYGVSIIEFGAWFVEQFSEEERRNEDAHSCKDGISYVTNLPYSHLRPNPIKVADARINCSCGVLPMTAPRLRPRAPCRTPQTPVVPSSSRAAFREAAH